MISSFWNCRPNLGFPYGMKGDGCQPLATTASAALQSLFLW